MTEIGNINYIFFAKMKVHSQEIKKRVVWKSHATFWNVGKSYTELYPYLGFLLFSYMYNLVTYLGAWQKYQKRGFQESWKGEDSAPF